MSEMEKKVQALVRMAEVALRQPRIQERNDLAKWARQRLPARVRQDGTTRRSRHHGDGKDTQGLRMRIRRNEREALMTTEAKFESRTALLTDVLVDQVFAERYWDLPVPYVEWFYTHVNRRFRMMYANPRDRRWLENKSKRIDPRNQCKVWIRHWLTAYTLNPETYQEQHP